VTNQKYFAELIDRYIAQQRADFLMGLVDGDRADSLEPLRDSPYMGRTWDWLWDCLHDTHLRTGPLWRNMHHDGSMPEGRFFTFLDYILRAADEGYSQEPFRGEQRRQALEEIAKGLAALATLRSLSFLGLSDEACLHRAEEHLIADEAVIRGYRSRAPHVKFMAQAAQTMRFLFGAPHYERVADMTNALFEVGVSADAARQAENRDPHKWPWEVLMSVAGGLDGKVEAEMDAPDKTSAEIAPKCPTDKTSSK
jgi:hypothetical protein